jgi:hypothetical protein
MSRSNGDTSCQDFIQTSQDNSSFLDCIVTGDGSLVFQYDPRRHVRACSGPHSLFQGPKVSFKNIQDQNHADYIFDKQGVIHKEFVPEGQTVSSAFWVEVIGRLLKRVSRVRPQFRSEGGWFLLHDNAPSHSALVVTIFLAKHGVVAISHPPYSPDLAPADFFSFLW